MVGTAPLTAWRNWAGNQRARPPPSCAPAPSTEVAEAVRTPRRDRRPDQGGRQRALVHRRRRAPTTGGSTCPTWTPASAVDPRDRLVTVPAGMTLHALNGAARRARPRPAQPRRHRRADRRRGDLHRHPRHRRAATAACPPSSRRSTLVTGTGEVLRCSADEHPDLFAAARVGARRARRRWSR